ncbi:ABC transporter permease [Chryseolinea lacunae]|uniref:ABC transporter permease n=1 Tax=Chryseolinea lacunae TaxID=2801331 RepID=A0ABS1KZS2_9BACT|nr:ABC transporter permease [Chryseolinea lacunae]MBL0744924.1 ABC transporter permease [Chryseolinea lacunae]
MRLLKWFCPPALYEGIEGDIHEQYITDVETLGERRARRRLRWMVIRFFRPEIILRNKFGLRAQWLMGWQWLKNYFALAGRSIIRDKVTSTIHVLGLSVGLAVAILILAYVRFELSYDNFHEHADQTYRVATKVMLQGDVISQETNTYDGIRTALQSDFPEVKTATSIYGMKPDGLFVRYEDEEKTLKPLESFEAFAADEHFFDVFSFPLMHGAPHKVFAEDYTAVVSETLARKYFGGDAMGKILTTDDGEEKRRFTITGVVEDVPPNSHFTFDLLLHWTGKPKIKQINTDFWVWGGQLYAVLSNGADPRALETKLNRLARERNGLKAKKDDYGQTSTFLLQPLRDIHLHSHLQYELGVNGNSVEVYVLCFLAIIILAIAWINYINLSTAVAIEKIKAVGIRKVMGASRMGLWWQVLTEAAVFNALSMTVAVGIVALAFPTIAALVHLPSGALVWVDGKVLLALLCFFGISTLISGAYPAYVIASFYPVSALKGKGAKVNVSLRKFLVVFQFSSALILIVVTLVSSEQLTFMRTRALGFTTDRLLVVKAFNFDAEIWSDSAGGFMMDEAYARQAEGFKEALRGTSSVANVATLSHLPGESVNWGSEFKAPSVDPEKAIRLKAVGVDYDFLKTLGVRLIAGRNFSPDFSTDRGNEGKRAVLLNEEAVARLGFKDPASAVHQHLQTYWGADYEIVGVVNSYHQLSLKENFEPLYFILQPRALSYYALQLEATDLSEAVGNVETIWKRHFPDRPFNHFFLDHYFNAQYQSDKRFATIAAVLSALAVFIACLGLYGMTSCAVAQRTKEIGIRKVLGASMASLVQLFSRDLVWRILLANLLTAPFLYVGIRHWMESYAFRIPLTVWFFAVPLAGMLALALLTVSVKIVFTSRRNPVDSLKHE